MIRYFFILAIALITTLSLNAQITATSNEFPSRSAEPRRTTKLQKERKLDVFNERRFKGFLFAEANYGLLGSFSKDEAQAVSAPVTVGIGYRLSPTWSVGVRAGQSVYNSDMCYFDRTFETRAQTKLQIATANVNAHFPLGLRGEAYGGFAAGYQNTTITALEDNPKTGGEERTVVRPQQGFFYTGMVGARFSLSSTISIQGELSSGLSTLNVGIRYRLR